MKNIFTFCLIIIIISCSSSNENINSSNDTNDNSTTSWYIDKNNLIGKFEPFPEIDSIQFTNNWSNLNIHDKHRVALLNLNGEKYAFPYGALAYYESLNFKINNKNYAITHCPLTNTTIAFALEDGHKIRSSGYRLYDNLVFYNSNTKDFISQMLQQTIGSDINTPSHSINTIDILDTEWSYVKQIQGLKISKVNDKDLGAYNLPLQYNANELKLDHMSISFNLRHLKKEINIIEFNKLEDTFICQINQNTIIGNKNLKTVNIFESNSNLSLSDSKTYIIDNLQNKYDWTGYCYSGPNKGSSLKTIDNYIGSTTAFLSIFDNINNSK